MMNFRNRNHYHLQAIFHFARENAGFRKTKKKGILLNPFLIFFHS
nr:MAG TPA: hypothetical protein [Caudoviricetes sp.]